MKILFIIPEIRGANKFSPFVMALAENLKQSGIEIDYFELKGHGVKKYINGISELNKHIKTNKYDLIHAHYNYSAYCASFQNKIPLIVSFLGSDLLAERNGLSKYLNKHINNRLFKKAKGFISKTAEMNQYIPDHLLKIIISNGVDLKIFSEISKVEVFKTLGLNPDKKYVLFPAEPGRTEKNYNLCLETMALVQKKNPNVELLTVFNKKQEELNLYYCASDVLLVTSLYEGGINVVKEAMACNCPIVTTKVGDVAERLHNVSQSFICKSNPVDLSQKVLDVIQTGSRSNGREQILVQKQETGQITERVIEFYKQVLKT